MSQTLTNSLTRLMALSLLLSVFTACQKKRSPEFKQGDGEHIYSLADFQGAQFELTTGKSVAPGIAADADELVLTEGNSVIRSFDAVSFASDFDIADFNSDDLSGFSFFGREDSAYTLEVGFTESHLIIYKIADKKDIPSNEMTHGIELEDGQTKVPLLGYPLSKYVIEYIKDARGKETKQKASIPKKFLAEASHFSIDSTNPTFFSSEEKLNLLPSSFFDKESEWFYEVTLVDGPLNARLGTQIESGKAKFFRTSNALMAVDVNIPKEVADVSGEKLPKVMQLPVSWVDFELTKSGASAFLEEKLLEDKDAGAAEWQNRKWGLFDFKRINSIDSANTNSIRVKRLEVDDNYISVVIASSNNGVAIHYSFAKDNNKVAGQIYPTLDMNKFGFWRSQRNVYEGSLTSSSKAIDKNIFLTRLYPELNNNTIEVYLTDNTPDHPVFNRAIKAAIEAWDEAFVEAARGSGKEPIRVKLNLDKRVKNGDVRYNKVSFYDFNVNVGGLLGYGPSVRDRRNGQVFSSTNHIYLRTYREGVYGNLKAYVRHKLDLYSDKGPQGIQFPNQVLLSATNINSDFSELVPSNNNMFDLVPASSLRAEASNGIEILSKGDDYSFEKSIAIAEQQIADHLDGKPFSTAEERESLRDFRNKEKEKAASMHSCNYQAAVANTFKDIERLCGELKFGDYVENLQSRKDSIHLDQLEFPEDVFNECALVLLEPTLKSTLVHEFGHNLGLTHNFKGSADDKNFRRDENGMPLVRSTSIMDYAHSDSDRGYAPGPYDVAAIRYGYYQTVELNETDADGKTKVVSIASSNESDTRSIEQRVDNPEKLKNYMYCWDYDIIGSAQIPEEDPSCRRHDRGSNPVQMVYALMDNFNKTATMYSNRFENKKLGDFNSYAYRSSILPMRGIYVKYRYLLHLKTKRLNDPYFVKNEGDFEQFIQTHVGDVSIKDLPKNSLELEKYVESLTEIQQYKLASDLIYKFLKELAFSETRYCTAWNKLEDGSLEFASAKLFSQLRTEIFNEFGVSINSCEEAAQNLMGEEQGFGKKGQEVYSYGNHFNSVTYTADEEEYSDKADLIRGFGNSRLFAFEALTDRHDSLYRDQNGKIRPMTALFIAGERGFFPSFMDNPVFRNDLIKTFEQRLVKGVSQNKFAKGIENARPVSGYLSQFSEESRFLKAMAPKLQSAMLAPGEGDGSRLSDLKADVYSRADFERIFKNAENVVHVSSASGRYYVAENPNSTIYRLIQAFNDTSGKISTVSLLDNLRNNKDEAVAATSRLVDAWFAEANKEPELNANLIKLDAIANATTVLAQEYLGLDSIADMESTELMNTYLGEARTLLDHVKNQGIEITQELIQDALFEVSGAQKLKQFTLSRIVSLAKIKERPYLTLAYTVLASAVREAAKGEYSAQSKAALIETVYAQLVASLEAEALSPEELSEASAQESILRNIILK